MPNFMTQLPKRSGTEQAHHHLIGHGKQTHFATEQGRLQLTIYPLPQADDQVTYEQMTAYHTDLGTLYMESQQSELWFNQLSNAPYPAANPIDDDSWERQWYRQQMHRELMPLFYPLTEVISGTKANAQPSNEPYYWYRLHWQHEMHRGALIIGLTDITLSAWLHSQTWQHVAQLDTGKLALSAPLILGSLTFDSQQLSHLAAGDVLHCTQPRFSCEGIGSFTFADTLFSLQANFDGTACHYLITQMTSISQTESSMNHLDDWANEPYSQHAMSDQHNANQTLPITLTITAGEVTLSLEELSQLTVGSMITARQIAPGHAQLRQGQRCIASGELVSIEGELGLQLTEIHLPTRLLATPPEKNNEPEAESNAWD